MRLPCREQRIGWTVPFLQDNLQDEMCGALAAEGVQMVERPPLPGLKSRFLGLICGMKPVASNPRSAAGQSRRLCRFDHICAA